MRCALVLLLALAGCSQQPVAQNEATPAPVGTPAVVATPTATPAAALPPGMIGTWTADPAKRCEAGTPLRIVITADTIRFYESVARITAVTQVDPHSWGIDAEVTGEGQTERRSFDLNLNEDGTLTRVEVPISDITYSRCKARS
ncbi:hypothetical protein [Sphingomonas sp. RS2018]